jgi:formate hydrogenlyase subunit 6/NADH:ubiquinone oxidoreductase subunit I
MFRFRPREPARDFGEVDRGPSGLGKSARSLAQAIQKARSIMYLLPNLWRTLSTAPITVRYPFAPLELPPYFRGRVVVEPDLCRGCGVCVRDCPAFGLELERTSRDRFRLIHYSDRCANCGQCEASCRFGAIRLVNEYVPATSRREELVEVLVEGSPPSSSPREAGGEPGLPPTGGGD